jgi:hypothetical protein
MLHILELAQVPRQERSKFKRGEYRFNWLAAEKKDRGPQSYFNQGEAGLQKADSRGQPTPQR